jgi:fucose permease
MQKTFTRDKQTWFTYFILAFYGYMLNILGPLTPYLRDELNINYTTAGFHFSAFAVGMLLSGLFGERLQKKWGYTKTIWLSAAGMAIGTLLFISARTITLTIPGTFLMGLLGTTILSSANAYLSKKYQELSAVALTEMNVVASFMAMCAPMLIGFFAPTIFGWRAAIVIALFALIVFAAIFLRPATLKNSLQTEQQAAQTSTRLPWTYWLYWLILFISVSIEFCFIFWGSDFLWTAAGLIRETAVFSLTLFLLAMLVGRMLGSRILLRASRRIVLRFSFGIIALGFFFFWSNISPIVSVIGLFISGLGISNLYPTTVALALRSVPDEMSAQASARTVLASGAAILSLPLLLGKLADLFSMKPAFLVVPVLIVIALGLNLIVAREMDKQKKQL